MKEQYSRFVNCSDSICFQTANCTRVSGTTEYNDDYMILSLLTAVSIIQLGKSLIILANLCFTLLAISTASKYAFNILWPHYLIFHVHFHYEVMYLVLMEKFRPQKLRSNIIRYRSLNLWQPQNQSDLLGECTHIVVKQESY